MSDRTETVLDSIDAELDKCICGNPIPENGPSLDYCSPDCQRRYIIGEEVPGPWPYPAAATDGRALNEAVNSLDILAATMHHADFTYNVTAELVNNLVTFATDPESDWEQLLAKLDRVIEVLEDIRDARRGQNTQRPPTREEIVRFARGGIVKAPESHVPTVITRGCDYVITPDEAYRWTADKPLRFFLDEVVEAEPTADADGNGGYQQKHENE